MTEVKMPETLFVNVELDPLYTEAQLKQYGDDRAKEALEKAAKVCEVQKQKWEKKPLNTDHFGVSVTVKTGT
jgi:hypothetical protein